jgi:hypothetical protein
VRNGKQIFQFNKDNLKHSFNVSIITFLVPIVSLQFDLSAGVQAPITALIIAAQSNLGQATLKERLRFIAVVIAGLYGLVSLIIISPSPNLVNLANFKENSMSRIRPGQDAEVSIALYPGKIFKAKVESLDWGVSAGQGTPSGGLPLVKNPQNWFKLAQRFPVRLKLTNLDSNYALRIGGSTSVTVDTGGGFILNGLARLWLRIGSYVSYIY